MTPAVEELIQELNKSGGQTTISAALNLKIGANSSRLDVQKRLYALERNGYITLLGEIIKIHPDYEVKPLPTLAERLADHLLQALDKLKHVTLGMITDHLKELSAEFRTAGARRKTMLADAMEELKRRGLELLSEVKEGQKYFYLSPRTA